MFTTNIDSKIEISYSSTEQISPETRSPGISDRSRVNINLTPRGDSLQNTQRVTTYYTPYGASASETELKDYMAQSATPKTPPRNTGFLGIRREPTLRMEHLVRYPQNGHHGQRQSGSRQTTKTKANKSRIVLPYATNLRRPI